MANLQSGTRLLEVDYAGIEAVLTNWYDGDPDGIRLAKLGTHAALASHVLARPYDAGWPDAKIAAYFKDIKASEPLLYDRSKRTVHGTNYGLTEYGMVRNFPQVFPTLAVAKRFKAIYAAMAPKLPAFQSDVRQIAYDLHYLGGAQAPTVYGNSVGQVFARNPRLKVHPFGYKHWFWSVTAYRPITAAAYVKRLRTKEPVAEFNNRYYAIGLGEDAKRCVAFFPQSTAAGVLKEAMLRLFDPAHASYIGDAYYGRTPLRAPIHDSLLLEVPNKVWDQVVERVYREMLRPVPELPMDWVSAVDKARLGFGDYLTIGVEGKAGLNWKDMTKIEGPTVQELGLSMESVYFAAEDDLDDEREDVASLGTVA